jgi:putative methionine-R-sulfoxide reductase with GAF domain
VSTRALEAVDRILNLGSDADDVLRAVVEELVREPAIVWAGVLFLEAGALVLGPEAGTADTTRRISVPVSYQGAVVGELAIDGEAETAFLDRVAQLVSTHVLLGWDTGGETWEP